MKRETIEKILNFLKEKEGHKLPKKWFDSIKLLNLVQELENHPDGTQYRYDGFLDLDNTNITKLPKDLYVGNSLFLSNCEQLTELPDKLHVSGFLDLNKCKQLKELPDNLYVEYSLYLNETNIQKIPNNLFVGTNLLIRDTPLADKYTYEEIYEIVASTGGKINGQIIR